MRYQRAQELETGVDDDVPDYLLLQLRDRGHHVALEHRRVVPAGILEGRGHDVLGQAGQSVRQLATPGSPPRGEELVAPPPQQQGIGAARLDELNRVELFAIGDLADPAADSEALFTVRVLDDSIERDELAHDDLSHFGSPSFAVSAPCQTRGVDTATAPKLGADRSPSSPLGRCPYEGAVAASEEEEGDARVGSDDLMARALMSRARAGDGDAFRELAEPHRRELLVHCYRMLGSLQDAEDALQDTLLSASQGLAGFEGRSSLRTWLYRIATNRCLNARRSTSRRQAKEWDVPHVEPPEPTRLGEVVWLEPLPDAMLTGAI